MKQDVALAMPSTIQNGEVTMDKGLESRLYQLVGQATNNTSSACSLVGGLTNDEALYLALDKAWAALIDVLGMMDERNRNRSLQSEVFDFA